MVFGNRDDRSGTGVGFTRNPATGEAGAYGDFLVNAQGEDVVAGIRNTDAAVGARRAVPRRRTRELLDIFDRLERHYRDMLDTEFTIEQGQLWMLQTRVGKRTGAAALRMAVAMTRRPRHPAHAGRGGAADQRPSTSTRCCTPASTSRRDGPRPRGLARVARRRRRTGLLPADDAVDADDRGEDVVLVRNETSPEDVHGMQVAEGDPDRPGRPGQPRRRRGPGVGHPRRGRRRAGRDRRRLLHGRRHGGRRGRR